MIKHILTSGWRLLRSDAFFSVITILSLAVGCGAALLVGAYLREELTFDRWVPNAQDVARIETTLTRPGSAPRESALAPSGLAPRVFENIDCVKAQVRSMNEWYTVAIDDRQYNHRVSYVDPSLFEVFPLPVLYGDATKALSDPTSVILAAPVAEKFFGNVNPVGKSIRLMPATELRVAAVLAPLPRTTQLAFEIIAPIKGPTRSDNGRAYESNLNAANVFYYVRAKPGQAEPCFAAVESFAQATIQQKIDADEDDRRPEVKMIATPIVDIHLAKPKLRELSPHGDPSQLALFAAVALLILIVSAFNYVTMSLARAVSLAREVGMRKALGATPADITIHYLAGSLIFTSLAVLLGFSIAELALPWFARSIGRDLTMASLHHPHFLAAAATSAVLLAIAVGLYPALYLGRQPAATALRGRMAGGRGLAYVNQGLLLVQLATATVMMCFVFAMMAQARFVSTQPLGFDRANRMVLFGVNYGPMQTTKRFQVFKKMLSSEPSIRGVTAAVALPTWNFRRKADVSAPDLPLSPSLKAIYVDVDLDFLPTMQAQLLAGRGFEEKYAQDRLLIDNPFAKTELQSAVISKETARRLVGNDYGSAVGKIVNLDTPGSGRQKIEIVGVVDDLHYRSLRFANEPMVFLPKVSTAQTYIIHFDPENRDAARARVNAAWAKAYPAHLISVAYLDEKMAELYEEDRRALYLVAGFGVLAVLLACLGLYGMSAFAAQRRTREIGLRKALGAERPDILRLMLAAFVRPAFVASALSLPVAIVVTYQWLTSFAVRTAVSVEWFIASMALVAAVATVAVFTNAMRAAAIAPADALRYE